MKYGGADGTDASEMDLELELEKRRNPERILMELAHKPHRGRLKIFFGYAAGVGKTYAMLDAARTDIRAGREVVAGYIEPHDRPETTALLDGMERLTPMNVPYKGITLKEFDLDAALIRRPDLILVDEMAHTNAEPCRHRKRWQDIQELLDAGINVYTTVNVQHLESLHDIVASITCIRVSERVPDRVFDEADKIELVDTPPEELLTRMKEGKIYQGERATRAMGNFFTLENLTALRELALRRTADQVNHTVIRQRQAGQREYYIGEHVLVCISPAPSNEKVIRTAARMASAFQAQMTAVVIVRPDTGEEQERFLRAVETNLTLAKQFGAQAVTLYGEDVAAQIAEYARRNGVSKIVIGRTVRQAGIGGIFNRRNLIDRLIAQAPNLDVYVIPDLRAVAQKRRRKLQFAGTITGRESSVAGQLPGCMQSRLPEQLSERLPQLLPELLGGTALLAMATALGIWIDRMGLGETNLVMVYMLAIVLMAGFAKYWVTGVAASVVSVLLFNFFFTEPRFSLHAAAAYYPVTFLVMLVCALMVSSLAARLKRQAQLNRQESQRLQILMAFSNKLKQAAGPDEALTVCAGQVGKLLDKNVVTYAVTEGRLELKQVFAGPGAPEAERGLLLARREQAVAHWVMKNAHRAGRTTDTLPEACGCYFPIKRDGMVYGVIGIQLEEGGSLRADDRNLLRVLLDETAVSLKAYTLQEQR